MSAAADDGRITGSAAFTKSNLAGIFSLTHVESRLFPSADKAQSGHRLVAERLHPFEMQLRKAEMRDRRLGRIGGPCALELLHRALRMEADAVVPGHLHGPRGRRDTLQRETVGCPSRGCAAMYWRRSGEPHLPHGAGSAR